MKYSAQTFKIPMYVISFECSIGVKKEVNFFNPDKAFNFYKKLKSDPYLKNVSQFRKIISPSEKKAILKLLKNRKG